MRSSSAGANIQGRACARRRARGPARTRFALFTNQCLDRGDVGEGELPRENIAGKGRGMRILRVWALDDMALDDMALAKPLGASVSRRLAAVECGLPLAALALHHGIFALSEICKGAVILGIGDVVIAEQLGDLIGVAAQTLRLTTDAVLSAAASRFEIMG